MKYIYLLFVPWLLVACGNKKTEQTQQAADSANSISISESRLNLLDIKTCRLAYSDVNSTITSPGKVVILSQYQSSVTPRINGTVEKIFVLEGQKIEKGQLLLSISSNEFIQLQENYLSAKSELEFLKTDYERQKKLRQENVTGEKDFQQIKSKYEITLTRMKAAEANLKMLNINIEKLETGSNISPYLEIHSPISGYLLTLPSTIGMSATATTELAHIISLDQLHADIFVYEKDIDQIFEGQEVDINFVNQSLEKTKGKVEFIGRGIDPVKRTVVIHAVFTSPKGNILPDMTLKATFKGTSQQKLTIPTSAILQDGDEQYVFVKRENNRFEKVTITPLSSKEDAVVINPETRLHEGVEVICKGSILVDGEMKKGEMDE